MGPYLRVSDGIQELGGHMQDEIPRQLRAELRRELHSLLLRRQDGMLSASANPASDLLVGE